MKIFFQNLILLSLLFSPFLNKAQNYPKDYFRSPLDISYRISGTFAEFRRDHFHSGMDIPIPSGSNVYSVADGWVARIRNQPTGYGNVLYIAHPNGYMSVYAHLKSFGPVLDAYFKRKQIEEQTYDLDFYPDSMEIPVTKGEIIGISGMTGYSTGAHLHFEMRRMSDESPVNPLLFGLPVKDPLKPVMGALRIYPVDTRNHLATSSVPKSIPLIKKADGYFLKQTSVLKVPGKFILGLQSVDLDGSGNRNGLFGLEIIMDGIPVYENRMELFSFDDFRAINSIVDYPFYLKSRKFVQISRIPECTEMEIFKTNVNGGIFDVTDGNEHQIEVKVKDYLGNTNFLAFKVKMDTALPVTIPVKPTAKPAAIIPCGSFQEFKTKDLHLFFPDRVLFDTLELKYSSVKLPKFIYSSIHHINQDNMPVNGNFIVSIKPEGLKKEDETKACIVRVGAKGGYVYAGGAFSNGWVTTQTRKFGAFAIVVDKTPPIITPVTHIKKGRKKIAVKNALQFKIGDNLSGIDKYCGYVNGKWVLMEYNPVHHSLIYKYDNQLVTGVNTFELFVVDRMGNESCFTKEIVFQSPGESPK